MRRLKKINNLSPTHENASRNASKIKKASKLTTPQRIDRILPNPGATTRFFRQSSRSDTHTDRPQPKRSLRTSFLKLQNQIRRKPPRDQPPIHSHDTTKASLCRPPQNLAPCARRDLNSGPKPRQHQAPAHSTATPSLQPKKEHRNATRDEQCALSLSLS